MKKPEILSHLQVLFRNKSERHTEALACFFTHTDQRELFPEEVVTKKHGTWHLKQKGAAIQPGGKFKTWAVYARLL